MKVMAGVAQFKVVEEAAAATGTGTTSADLMTAPSDEEDDEGCGIEVTKEEVGFLKEVKPLTNPDDRDECYESFKEKSCNKDGHESATTNPSTIDGSTSVTQQAQRLRDVVLTRIRAMEATMGRDLSLEQIVSTVVDVVDEKEGDADINDLLSQADLQESVISDDSSTDEVTMAVLDRFLTEHSKRKASRIQSSLPRHPHQQQRQQRQQRPSHHHHQPHLAPSDQSIISGLTTSVFMDGLEDGSTHDYSRTSSDRRGHEDEYSLETFQTYDEEPSFQTIDPQDDMDLVGHFFRGLDDVLGLVETENVQDDDGTAAFPAQEAVQEIANSKAFQEFQSAFNNMYNGLNKSIEKHEEGYGIHDDGRSTLYDDESVAGSKIVSAIAAAGKHAKVHLESGADSIFGQSCVSETTMDYTATDGSESCGSVEDRSLGDFLANSGRSSREGRQIPGRTNPKNTSVVQDGDSDDNSSVAATMRQSKENETSFDSSIGWDRLEHTLEDMKDVMARIEEESLASSVAAGSKNDGLSSLERWFLPNFKEVRKAKAKMFQLKKKFERIGLVTKRTTDGEDNDEDDHDDLRIDDTAGDENSPAWLGPKPSCKASKSIRSKIRKEQAYNGIKHRNVHTRIWCVPVPRP